MILLTIFLMLHPFQRHCTIINSLQAKTTRLREVKGMPEFTELRMRGPLPLATKLYNALSL